MGSRLTTLYYANQCIGINSEYKRRLLVYYWIHQLGSNKPNSFFQKRKTTNGLKPEQKSFDATLIEHDPAREAVTVRL